MGDNDVTVRTSTGRTLAYAETGQHGGVPFFYFHGIPGVRLIGVDRPGYGGSEFRPGRYSDWPMDVATVADALKIDRFAIVAHLGGGPYAIACALGLSERVTSIGIVSGVGPAEMPKFRNGMGKTDALMIRIVRLAPWVSGICTRRPVGTIS